MSVVTKVVQPNDAQSNIIEGKRLAPRQSTMQARRVEFGVVVEN